MSDASRWEPRVARWLRYLWTFLLALLALALAERIVGEFSAAIAVALALAATVGLWLNDRRTGRA